MAAAEMRSFRLRRGLPGGWRPGLLAPSQTVLHHFFATQPLLAPSTVLWRSLRGARVNAVRCQDMCYLESAVALYIVFDNP
mmetsp:Transcript_42285/g.122728  ORF Transcript_42285/g.122728 Transcript_42285/m.122728 type:complete len:81 (-) Transcript_42285:238-480(-)